MAIVVQCPGCRTRLTVGDDRAGTTLECPKCDAAITVPASPPPGADVIRFACPTCRKVYKCPARDAGKKMVCKACSSVVVIPAAPARPLHGIPLPPEDETEASEDVPPPPPPLPPPVPPPPPPPVEYDWSAATDDEHDEDDGDDDFSFRTRPRRRRRRRSGMVSAVAILYLMTGLLNLACAALVLAGGALLAEMRDISPQGRVAIGGVASFLALIVVLLGIPDLLAAYGIWNRRHWGYVLGLILAGINGLWAFASIFWADVCSVFVCGSCGIFAFVVLLNSRYAAEFS